MSKNLQTDQILPCMYTVGDIMRRYEVTDADLQLPTDFRSVYQISAQNSSAAIKNRRGAERTFSRRKSRTAAEKTRTGTAVPYTYATPNTTICRISQKTNKGLCDPTLPALFRQTACHQHSLPSVCAESLQEPIRLATLCNTSRKSSESSGKSWVVTSHPRSRPTLSLQSWMTMPCAQVMFCRLAA